MLFKRTLAAAAIVLGTAFAANAADIPVIVAPPPAPPPAPMAPAADWTGAYFGGFGAVSFGPYGTNFTAGTLAGYDVQFGNIVAGVNFRGSWNFIGPPSVNLEGGARAGFAVTESILFYANAAIGYIGPVPDWAYYSFGGGVELALSDTLHVFGEVRRSVFCCGPPNVSVHFGVVLHN